jgi:hypothetical protein
MYLFVKQKNAGLGIPSVTGYQETSYVPDHLCGKTDMWMQSSIAGDISVCGKSMR